MEDWISLRAFAAFRGVTLRAVQKAIETGRVTAVRRDDGGKLSGIERNRASLEWDSNTDPAEAVKSGAPIGGQTSSGAETAADELPLDAPVYLPAAAAKEDFGYLKTRAELQEIQKKTADLEYQQALGLLVSAADAEATAARRYTIWRDKLQNMESRGPIIAAELGIPEKGHLVSAILRRESKRIANECADDASAEVARGAAERVAA